MNKQFSLAPAHRDFLKSSFPAIAPESWHVTGSMQAGSERRFVRVHSPEPSGHSYIMIVWDSADNDWARYLSIEREIGEQIPVLPKIYAADTQHGLILEQDLGTMTLKDALKSAGTSRERMKLYESTVAALAQWHSVRLQSSSAVRERSMDEEMFLWESAYCATHCISEYFGQDALLDSAWEYERVMLAQEAAALPKVCMHRDFQSENIMIQKGDIRFVDFQGARLGPAQYDLASLLFDPYAPALRPSAIERLFASYCAHAGQDMSARSFHVAAIQRLLQACGAYCNLSLHKGKDWYREFIPIGLKRLLFVLERENSFPHIASVVQKCSELRR